jgi:hypothetical protein
MIPSHTLPYPCESGDERHEATKYRRKIAAFMSCGTLRLSRGDLVESYAAACSEYAEYLQNDARERDRDRDAPFAPPLRWKRRSIVEALQSRHGGRGVDAGVDDFLHAMDVDVCDVHMELLTVLLSLSLIPGAYAATDTLLDRAESAALCAREVLAAHGERLRRSPSYQTPVHVELTVDHLWHALLEQINEQRRRMCHNGGGGDGGGDDNESAQGRRGDAAHLLVSFVAKQTAASASRDPPVCNPTPDPAEQQRLELFYISICCWIVIVAVTCVWPAYLLITAAYGRQALSLHLPPPPPAEWDPAVRDVLPPGSVAPRLHPVWRPGPDGRDMVPAPPACKPSLADAFIAALKAAMHAAGRQGRRAAHEGGADTLWYEAVRNVTPAVDTRTRQARCATGVAQWTRAHCVAQAQTRLLEFLFDGPNPFPLQERCICPRWYGAEAHEPLVVSAPLWSVPRSSSGGGGGGEEAPVLTGVLHLWSTGNASVAVPDAGALNVDRIFRDPSQMPLTDACALNGAESARPTYTGYAAHRHAAALVSTAWPKKGYIGRHAANNTQVAYMYMPRRTFPLPPPPRAATTDGFDWVAYDDDDTEALYGWNSVRVSAVGVSGAVAACVDACMSLCNETSSLSAGITFPASCPT